MLGVVMVGQQNTPAPATFKISAACSTPGPCPKGARSASVVSVISVFVVPEEEGPITHGMPDKSCGLGGVELLRKITEFPGSKRAIVFLYVSVTVVFSKIAAGFKR